MIISASVCDEGMCMCMMDRDHMHTYKWIIVVAATIPKPAFMILHWEKHNIKRKVNQVERTLYWYYYYLYCDCGEVRTSNHHHHSKRGRE